MLSCVLYICQNLLIFDEHTVTIKSCSSRSAICFSYKNIDYHSAFKLEMYHIEPHVSLILHVEKVKIEENGQNNAKSSYVMETMSKSA